MDKKWKIKFGPADEALLSDFDCDSIVKKILFNRGLKNKEEIERFFDFSYNRDVLDPFLFHDMEKAVKRIIKAKEKKEKIAIFGDYDADGVTASALLFETLKNLGFLEVEIYIPDRQIEGYGMNPSAVEYLSGNKVNLIITVDCGITNAPEIELAKKLGMDVVITDHHCIPDNLPPAVAIINPNIKDCGYKFQHLAGVGVAFKLAQALYQKIDPDNIEKLKWSLDLVSIGTIADYAPLLGENRVLVKYGLIVLSKTKRTGLLELFKVGRIEVNENCIPDTRKIMFQIAPRINAAGRIDHANISYKIMLEEKRAEARELALEIEKKNQDRQKITGEIFNEIKILAENSFKNKKFIFAYNEHWPAGILGLVAGKAAEEFNKPAVIMQKQPDEFTGSLRSIPAVDIMEVLEECKDLLTRFGGHSQAAGVRVKHSDIEKFYDKFSQTIEKKLEGVDISPEIDVDLEISFADINWELMMEIKKMEPFGENNEEPVFLVRNAVVDDIKVVGNGNKHLKLQLRDQGMTPKTFDSIGFGLGSKISEIKKGEILDIIFNLQEDEWNGNKKLQLNLIDFRIAENDV